MSIEVRPLPPPTLPPPPVQRERAGAPPTPANEDVSRAPGFLPFGEDGPTFLDVLDIINPLQHLPVISVLYREFTGDQIDPFPRVAGAAIFGGWIGAVSALANVVVEVFSGKDIGAHVYAWVSDAVGWNDAPDAIVLAANAANAANDNDGGEGGAAPPDTASVSEWARAEAAYRASLATVAPLQTRTASAAVMTSPYPVDHHA